MIQFPCPCGHAFSLDDDQAGGFVQCPTCHRLNDIPALGEIHQIASDGTYILEPPVPRPQTEDVVADLAYIYQKSVRDNEGNEIDLRTTPAELEAIGKGELRPLVPVAINGKRIPPRYDPETGELITSFDVAEKNGNEADSDEIPMAKPALNYATGEAANKHLFLKLFVNLLNPLNVAVMFAVFCVHLLLMPVLLVVFAGIMFLIVAIPFIGGAILAHYGNVIEDVGPHERDELPRPLRDVGWHEDLWSPFCHVFGSLMICYAPAFVLPGILHRFDVSDAGRLAVMFLLAAAGTLIFPAVLLTLQCGNTVLNLRPDRVAKVMSTCGKDYLFTLVAWIVAAPVYLWGFLGTTAALIEIMHPTGMSNWIISWTFTLPALAAGIFLTHYFCMCVGMLYRVHYDQFPWVLQRHERTIKDVKTPGLPPSRRRGKLLTTSTEGNISRDVGGRTARTRGPISR